MQNNQPISFASRSLTDAEKNYSQIEKELLAILYSLKKFHFFTHGRFVKVFSDHKPLESIMTKPIHKVPSAKLQRMRIKLLNFNVKVEYMPGKDLHIADYLSRYYENTNRSEEDTTITEAVLSINASDERVESFRNETEKDKILKQVKLFCIKGWPKDDSKLRDEIKFYFNLRNEILIDKDILFYGTRMIVPQKMRNEMIQQLHESHQGIEKMRKRANEMLYWPGINRDIVNIASSCQLCQSYQSKNRKEPLINHEIP